MATCSFLTKHAQVPLCIAHDPGVRLRDIAASVGVTERRAYGIVSDLTATGYVVKEKDLAEPNFKGYRHRWAPRSMTSAAERCKLTRVARRFAYRDHTGERCDQMPKGCQIRRWLAAISPPSPNLVLKRS